MSKNSSLTPLNLCLCWSVSAERSWANVSLDPSCMMWRYVVEQRTNSLSWNLRERMRTAQFWLGFAGASVQWTLSSVKNLSGLRPSHCGSMSCTKSSRGHLPSAPFLRPNIRMFFLLLQFSKSSVFAFRYEICFVAETNADSCLSRCTALL